ncbi:hypothetical protein M422DRAFT_249916 [Sphaerobolus stellatus SS14]|uniref:Uncharacterized protein n=1 Tax=Sphaerobolus stellatus (strain SS14) TaxID=990650 RepID=A0A0C9W3S3_SPHS4|nr:hypothetical protein M422DRAFT_249916 [Sphaerobolus stellatus SS14]
MAPTLTTNYYYISDVVHDNNTNTTYNCYNIDDTNEGDSSDFASTPNHLVSKCFATDTLAATTLGRLRAPKHINDESGIRHVNPPPKSPTANCRRAASLDSQAVLQTLLASLLPNKNHLQDLHFRKKIPRSQMMTSCPVDSACGSQTHPAIPTPPEAMRGEPKTPMKMGTDKPADKEDTDMDPSTLQPATTTNGNKDHFLVDNNDRDNGGSPDQTLPTQSTAQGTTNLSYTALSYIKRRSLPWMTGGPIEKDKTPIQVKLIKHLHLVLGRQVLPGTFMLKEGASMKPSDIWPFNLSDLLEAEAKLLTDRYIW